ncbi:glycosyltransferase [Anabaena sp. AL93]|uniref:glycosyltransferase n=1 Tax=Anabaena sp. AL93 TaxID=1678133 RepID=UPI000B20073C|nr:glycosyltransferase [Anabaena sp. AL93]
MKKHILLYTDDPGLGGVAQYNHSLLRGLVQLGYQITCIQSEYNTPLIEVRENLGIKHIWLDFDTLNDEERKITDTASSQRILSEIKPDLIIFSDSWALANLGAKQVAIQYNIPFIAIVGLVGVYPGGLPNASLKLMSEVYHYAKAVIAVSENNLNLLYQGYGLPKNKGEVIYYGRPKEYFTLQNKTTRNNLRQQLDIPKDAIVCLTSARYDKIKGYDFQLAAIEQLKLTKIWKKLYFIWVGSGSLETELKEKIHQQKLTDKIKLLGQRFDIPDLLDISDIFILPSLLEGMPLAIMEAMAKGLPVIASAVSGIPEELGNTGQLIADPKVEPEIAINQLAETIKLWTSNEDLRQTIGQNCQQRASALFTEERMINQTKDVIERALLPVGDYMSQKLQFIKPDAAFPNMIVGNTNTCEWQYLRREIPHNWYVDQRHPYIGFLSRDEASILYNNALQFAGKRALEIGCWLGWSACHLALAGVELDVIDPVLENPDFYTSVSNSLQDVGVIDHVNLIPGYSPEKVHEIVQENQRKWSLIFIDGNHDAPYPLNDAITCEPYAEEDAMILFHDLSSPDVAEGLNYFRSKGWNTLIYQTMQIMGVAWRGNVQPITHIPDPSVNWKLPSYLHSYQVSGLSNDHNKKALIFFPHNPYPAKTGAHQRCLSLIKALQAWGYNITLCGWNIITDHHYPQDTAALKTIESALNVKVLVYKGTAEDYQFIQTIQLQNNSDPFGIYTPPGLKQFFEQIFDQISPQLVVVNYSLWGELINNNKFSKSLTVLDAINLFTLNTQMQNNLQNYLSSPPYHPDKINLEAIQENFYLKQDLQPALKEYQIFDKYDYTLVISNQETSQIANHTQNTKLIYIPMTYAPVVVSNSYQEKPIFAVGPNRFNIQGYLYFTKQVLPKLLALIPDFELQVVGMICEQLAPVNGVELSGFVPDLTSIYSNSCFAICPLIGGTGQQVKIVEAMAHGLPVIALSNVAHSSPIEHGVNGFIANNADEFAQYTIQLWQDRELCERLGIAARKTIAENFSPEVIKDKLSPIINEANLKSSLQSSSFKQTQIIIDGVFFQLYKTGIARVWKSLLEQWANTEFANHIIVLDRANTAPKINGIRYRTISPYNYNDTESDRQMLQQICDEEGAELFISTYYTTPINTPSVFMAYDMIPEVLGGNLNEPMWIEKHNAIKHASAFISISENTAKDLSTFFPNISLESITVAHCGVDPLFSPTSENEINAFKYKYGINKPYFLLGGLGGYKNSIFFLQAFSQLINKHSFDIVATGAGSQLPPEWRQYTAGCTFHGLQLSDAELRLAYAGAAALVYPSQYEGFGMPVAEAMACGCPVITTPNASLPEVGGEAVIYVKDDDIEGMTNALCDVQKPSLRRNLIQAGLQQSQKFSWDKMADIVSNVLVNQTLESLPFNLGEINLIMFPDWNQSEDDLYVQLGEVIKALATDSHADETTLLIYVSNSDPETADGILSSIAMNLIMEDEIDITESIQISLIEEISEKQWQTLLPHLQSRVVLELENQEAIAKFQADTLPTFEIGL